NRSSSEEIRNLGSALKKYGIQIWLPFQNRLLFFFDFPVNLYAIIDAENNYKIRFKMFGCQ
ncbi:MAG: hypothetical protein CMH98_04860, partial [Oceanospirillaceae bacterium]|nr:hypothetical protein [Oceanospirillaceae bacterium]